MKLTHCGLGGGIGLLSAALLSAASPVNELSAPGPNLEPGDRVTLSWTAPELEAGDDEMELVLSLDGGATYAIRVTGRIPAGSSSWAWRVPLLPTMHARLALRAGRDEDDESERLVLVSRPFAIGATPGAAPEPLFPVGREWRTRDALEGSPVREPRGSLESRETGESVQADVDDESAADTPPASPPLPRLRSKRPGTSVDPVPDSPPPPDAGSRILTPLRV